MNDKFKLSNNVKLNSLLNHLIDQVNDYGESQIRQLNSLTKIGISLSAEKDINKIFDMILEEALLFTNADGATIYTVSEDKKYLDFQVVYNRTMNLRMGGTHQPITWPSIPFEKDKQGRSRNLSAYVAETGMSTNVEDAYHQNIFNYEGTKESDENHNYHSKSMVAIPLKNHENEVLGVIQLINALNKNGKIVPFTDEHIAILDSLASQAAISLTTRQLINDLEKLLNQFIKSIGDAIDRKSRYTAGHVKRVATLTENIAKLIHKEKSGFYEKTSFTEDQFKEISMAGWMHDLGKIITPTHIMDKSTKLETIFDRIQLIESRFELLKAIIEKDIMQATIDDDSRKIKELSDILVKLSLDFHFVERCNIGGEFMEDSDLKNLKRIAEFSYFSSDKRYILITKDEYKNLSIRKGTLLFDEMQVMREHALVTKEMLSKLSFPKKFKDVPLYASSHHEKLSGKGYPSQLSANDLPLQARIIAVADLFEALTASDRPYKTGKTLTESLTIMARMVKDNDIDGNIFNLFLETGLFKKYGEEYLHEFQVDDVDIESIKNIINEKN